MKRSNGLFTLTLALLISLFTACVEDPNPGQLAAPQVPPSEMFNMPTEVLGTTTNDTANSNATYKNWVHAGLNLLVWNTAVVAHMALPVGAFALAVNEDPVFIGNSTFEWTYQYQAPPILGGKTYDIVLTGKYIASGQEVEWKMLASETGGSFSNFEWYTGVVKTDFSEGYFIVNKDPQSPTPYFQVDYDRVGAGPDFSLRFTNIEPGSNGQGGYIEYRVQSTQTFNRAFDVMGGPNQSGQFIEIQWQEPTREGRVKSPGYFNNNDWHCWNSMLEDEDC